MNYGDKMKCTKCGGWAKPHEFNIEGFKVRGWKCKCGEEMYSAEDLEPVLLINKYRKSGIKAKISRSGNGYVLRIPKNLAEALQKKFGDKVPITISGEGTVVIEG